MVWDGDAGIAREQWPDTVDVLTPADVPDILDLVERTQPGPMRQRTIELGTYLGIRDDGVLVAMAGMRMHLPGLHRARARSAPTTTHRGTGWRSCSPVRWSTRSSSGARSPCLHAVITNTPAIRLYETLGFTLRRELTFAALPRAPDRSRHAQAPWVLERAEKLG